MNGLAAGVFLEVQGTDPRIAPTAALDRATLALVGLAAILPAPSDWDVDGSSVAAHPVREQFFVHGVVLTARLE